MHKALSLFLILLAFGLAAFVAVNIHEIGHTALARLFGDADAWYALYRRTATSSCLGCADFDPARLSPLGQVLATLGGVIFTQLAAMLIFRVRDLFRRGRAGIFLAVLLPFVLDLPFQAAQIVSADVTRQTRASSVDLKDFVWLFSGQTKLNPGLVKTGVIVFAGVVLLLWAWAIWAGWRRGAKQRARRLPPGLPNG